MSVYAGCLAGGPHRPPSRRQAGGADRTDRWRRPDDSWELWPVRKVARVYLHVGPQDSDSSWLRMERDRPQDNNRTIAGWHERELRAWRRMADRMAEAIRQCPDIEALKTVAFALGLEGPPDFSALPAEAAAPKDQPR